ncbi:Uncharacterised protein [Neisseria zoodegmatis]|uniref:Uncharacterized protein n=1 Tax=Neisseria zoodegmatis TaxID=326523 RepID=A0AB38DPS8_9NEIS|nr:hypothetical protein [Neisseria zoodegmatis]OSI09530.1 hypothetical protein BWD10_08830 [Neisseria zoodegmatis]SNU79380.1 Uncharacterised protein [Neisseria zoodegmatis]
MFYFEKTINKIEQFENVKIVVAKTFSEYSQADICTRGRAVFTLEEFKRKPQQPYHKVSDGLTELTVNQPLNLMPALL